MPENRNERYRLFYETMLGSDLLSSTDLLRSMMDTAIRSSEAERGFFFVERGDRLDCVIARDGGRRDIAESDRVVSREILAHVRGALEAVVREVGDGARLSESAMAIGVKSYISVPVRARGRTFGVGYLDRLKAQPARFTIEQRASVVTLLGDMAEVIESIEKHEEERCREETARRFPGIVGRDPRLLDLLSEIPRLAATAAPALILGETGTGKERVAAAIHEASPRAEREWVTCNCASFAPELIDSELFGHVGGAFTGAHGSRAGLFEQASGGTLFLDEVADLPLEAQARLLRAIDPGEIRRVGESVARRVDVRVVAATSRDLARLAGEGRFRKDLYYRLSTFVVRLPPLAARRGDIPLLARHFLAFYGRQRPQPLIGFRRAALDALSSAPWPGNVRELESAVRRACAFAVGPWVERTDLRLEEHALGLLGPAPSDIAGLALVGPEGFRSHIEVERDYFRSLLEHCGHNYSQAAELAGMPRSSLIDRLARLGLRGGGTKRAR